MFTGCVQVAWNYSYSPASPSGVFCPVPGAEDTGSAQSGRAREVLPLLSQQDHQDLQLWVRGLSWLVHRLLWERPAHHPHFWPRENVQYGLQFRFQVFWSPPSGGSFVLKFLVSNVFSSVWSHFTWMLRSGPRPVLVIYEWRSDDFVGTKEQNVGSVVGGMGCEALLQAETVCPSSQLYKHIGAPEQQGSLPRG